MTDEQWIDLRLGILDRHVLERAIRLLIATGPLSTWETDSAGRLLDMVKPRERIN